MATPIVNITGLTRGDTERLRVTVTRDGSAVDLTASGTTLWFTVKKSYADTDVQAVLKKNTATLQGIATTGTTGEAIITIDAGETSSFNCEPSFKYHYDVQLVSGSPDAVVVETVVKGDISWAADVTRSIA